MNPSILLLALLGTALQEPPRPGLVLEAGDGERRVVLLSPAPALALAPDESVHPQLAPAFTARWEGLLRILRPGRYSFTADGAEVRVGGRDPREGPLDLAAGDHAIRVDLVRAPGTAVRLRLGWASDAFKPEPVPASALFHRGSPEGLEASLRAELGRDLARRHGCAACHALPSAPGLRRGPDLERVGSRTSARWIAAWLEAPRRFRADAAMPAVPLEAAERADVAAYLAGLRGPEPAPAALPTDRFRLARGGELFDRIGCARCHTDRENPLAGLGSKFDAPALARFLRDPLAVDPSGWMPDLALQPDEAAVLAEFLVESRNPEFERDVPAGDLARGEALVRTRGCLGCHSIGKPPHAPSSVPLRPEGRGCLSPAPAGRAPRYGFSDEERAALEAFLRQPPDRARAPAHEADRAVRAFRCTACHVLEDAAPSGLKDVAPPPLTGAAEKMRTSWLEEVLLRRKRIRPWMDLRMPHFGEANVASLPRDLAARSGVEPEPAAADPAPPPDRLREGVRLLGAEEGGLSCISCHDWKDRVALATRGPDLTEMHARLRPDWFRRWLRDPGRIQPGTAMPSFFAGLPEAETERRMDLLWAALSAGKEMPAPGGFPDPRRFLLAVEKEPVVVRALMPDASARSVAVGLPGGVSYCFDAQTCLLRYAWRGEFLDMAPVWGGRGGQPARPLGPRVHAAPPAAALRIGDPARESPVRFKGYVLVEGVPEFHYVLGAVEVRERITALPEAKGLVRTYRLGAVEGDAWIVVQGDGTWTSSAGEFRDGRLLVPGGPAPAFTVTVRFK